jgi:hypothetical protein
MAEVRSNSGSSQTAVSRSRSSHSLPVRWEKDFFPRYAMIAYESDVQVLRREKF